MKHLHMLQGPFLTALEAATRAHVPVELVRRRPDLLRLGGRSLPEVYFAFQFDDAGVNSPLAAVVRSLKQRYCDKDISEWLATPHPDLEYATPVGHLLHGGAVGMVMKAAAFDGPVESSASQLFEASAPAARRR